MKTLIVYDSAFGNTEKVARAIGAALGPEADVEILHVSSAKPEQFAGLALLIVGSPTQGFRPTKAIKGLLRSIPANGLKGVGVAAFDTGISINDMKPSILRVPAKLFGYAAKPISAGLAKKGGEPVVPPEGFFVIGTKGPLKEGELERAAAWAKQIMATR